MSTTDPRPPVRQGAASENHGGSYSGWVPFAGVCIGLLAGMNLIYGIGAISRSSFFVGDAKYVLADLRTWGWILVLVAVAQAVTALGVIAQWPGVRWIGVAIAGLNAVVQALALPSYPVWALMLVGLDILVIYALIMHGADRD